jgi:glyoxylase-like metal-dependent hydrolase (beta-lactamase superfamily II)
VHHPGGDLLIDAGFGAGVAEHVAMLPRIARASLHPSRTVRQQLADSGYDLGRLLGVIVTHSHWDHVSGLDSLPVPIWINDAELRYTSGNSDGKVFRSVSKDRQIRRYSFAETAYLGFPASFDAHGDGSVVVALTGGHTPRLGRGVRDAAVG